MNIRRTSEIQKHHLTMAVYGHAGAGKTRMCATFEPERTLINSAESGLLSIRDKDLAFFQVKEISDMIEITEALASDSEEVKGFDMICIDSLTEVAEAVLSYEKEQTNHGMKAYGALAERMIKLIKAYRDMPRHVLFTMKMNRIEDRDSGRATYGPDLPGGKLKQAIPYYLDQVGYVEMTENEQGEKESLITFEKFRGHPDVKDRSGVFKEGWFPADLTKIAKMIAMDTRAHQKAHKEAKG